MTIAESVYLIDTNQTADYEKAFDSLHQFPEFPVFLFQGLWIFFTAFLRQNVRALLFPVVRPEGSSS